jgi:hypothetical protein
VWIEARPGLSRIHVLAGDILDSLGKRRDVAGKGRNEAEDVIYAIAWLRAHAVRFLVVLHAERLEHGVLRRLSDLADRAGCDLWLVHTSPSTDAFHLALDRLDPEERELATLPTASPKPTETTPVEAEVLPDLPRVDFTMFLATCQERLEPADLARVEQSFTEEVAAHYFGLADGGNTVDAVGKRVHAILNPAPDDDMLTLRLRALQVAAWRRNLFVAVDLPKVINSEERPRQAPHIADEKMAVYKQPHRALAVALTREGFGAREIGEIRIADADPAGRHLQCAGRRVGVTGQPVIALRAQMELRKRQGAGDAEPLIPHTPKALAKVLTEAASDLGVHVHGRRVERTRPKDTMHLRRIGITVAELR